MLHGRNTRHASSQSLTFQLHQQSLFDCLTKSGNIGPLARELKGFTKDAVLESQVSRVSDQESEKISTVTVLGTSDKATKFLSDLDNLGMSLSTVLLIAFEKHGARCHLIRIE